MPTPTPARRTRTRADARFAGLQWTFARIRYDGSKLPGLSGCDTYDECWTIDYPAAEQNLSRRVKTVTSIQVNEPVVVTIDDPALWTYPWIYLVEPGTWIPKDNEVADPARVPAARRHDDVRRLPRSDRVGQPRAAR